MHTIRNVSNWVIILFFVGFISGDVCGQTAQGKRRTVIVRRHMIVFLAWTARCVTHASHGLKRQ